MGLQGLPGKKQGKLTGESILSRRPHSNGDPCEKMATSASSAAFRHERLLKKNGAKTSFTQCGALRQPATLAGDDGLATGWLFRQPHRIEARGENVIQEKRHDVSTAAHREQNGIPRGLTARGEFIVIQQ